MATSPCGHTVFVYGTLLDGEANHGLLNGAKRLGQAFTPAEFTMHDLGGYPAIVTGGVTAIRGEVCEIDDHALGRLDALEGHPHYYQRQHIRLQDGRSVFAYILPSTQARGFRVIPSGDWRRRDERDSDRQAASAG